MDTQTGTQKIGDPENREDRPRETRRDRRHGVYLARAHALAAVQANAVLALCEKHSLTVYDATYLELAQRRNLSLGTLDTELRRAAQAEGVTHL